MTETRVTLAGVVTFRYVDAGPVRTFTPAVVTCVRVDTILAGATTGAVTTRLGTGVTELPMV